MKQSNSTNKINKAKKYAKVVNSVIKTEESAKKIKSVVDNAINISSMIYKTLNIKNDLVIDTTNFSIISLPTSKNTQYPNSFT